MLRYGETMIETLVAVMIDGMSRGVLLAILGVGITLVFGMAEILNIAQGALAVAGALTLALLTSNGYPLILSAFIAIGVLAIFGLVTDRLVLSRLYKSEGEERILVGIFATLAIGLILEGVMLRIRGGDFTVTTGLRNVEILNISITLISLVTIAAGSLVLFAVFLFLERTYIGKALRTVTQDETGAHLCGVRPGRMRTIAFVLSTVLAATAGIFQVMISATSVASAFTLTGQALIVSIVGGVRNLVGTVIAGLAIGIVLTVASFLVGTSTALIITYAAAIGVLLVRTEL